MSDSLTIRKAVQFAVTTEGMAEKAYSHLAERFTEQEEIGQVFSLLAADEKSHRAQFTALLESLPPEANKAPNEEERMQLIAMARSEFFSADAGLMAKLEKSQTLDDALVQVLGFEKATLGFYRAVADTLGQEPALETIIAAEKRHIARLMKYIITDEKMKGLADEW